MREFLDEDNISCKPWSSTTKKKKKKFFPESFSYIWFSSFKALESFPCICFSPSRSLQHQLPTRIKSRFNSQLDFKAKSTAPLSEVENLDLYLQATNTWISFVKLLPRMVSAVLNTQEPWICSKHTCHWGKHQRIQPSLQQKPQGRESVLTIAIMSVTGCQNKHSPLNTWKSCWCKRTTKTRGKQTTITGFCFWLVQPQRGMPRAVLAATA